jgi:hypothetical protein
MAAAGPATHRDAQPLPRPLSIGSKEQPMKSVLAIVAVVACSLAAACSVRSDRVVEKPAPTTTTQQTTVTESAPGYPAATTTTTTRTPAR